MSIHFIIFFNNCIPLGSYYNICCYNNSTRLLPRHFYNNSDTIINDVLCIKSVDRVQQGVFQNFSVKNIEKNSKKNELFS